MGIFDGEKLIAHWRAETKKNKTADEYAILIRSLLYAESISTRKISGAMISCVVPPLVSVMAEVVRKVFECDALVVGPGIKTGMPILYDNPREVGADRIVNAVAAYRQRRSALICIDFGTATTFDVVSGKGEYLGGIIARAL
jgi:type III pantothenate kinase